MSGFADYWVGDMRKRKEASKCKAFGLGSWENGEFGCRCTQYEMSQAIGI